MECPTYSIVVPVYNEQESLPRLVMELRAVMAGLDGPAEVLLVDDGSRDASARIMLATNADDQRFKVLRLSRNFGHQIAITAGMDAARGQAVVVIDADLQDPPQVILKLAERWRQGYEIVHAVRERREGETLLKKASARIYYSLLRRLSDVDQQVDAGDFRLIDRKAADAFLSMRERNRYVRGMFCWIGFRQATVPYVRAARQAGRSKYPLGKMLGLAFDGIAGFSAVPLRLGIAAGLLMAVAAVGYGVVAVALKLAGGHDVPGYASLLATITFLSGVQLIVMGIMCQYLGRIYDEVKGRPLYIVSDARGFADGACGPRDAPGFTSRAQGGPLAQALRS
jgi:polyisoprenyl-phosphate glycosyltransferase